MIQGYEFRYETLVTDPPESPNIPAAFMIGGITDEVATGILYGLQQVVSITNVSSAVVTTESQEFLGTAGAVRGPGS
jgi:hypothetical protein